jgi:hypothetical protein
VVGVLRRKGANMMGLDQDDIVMAPWPTIKYRVSGTMLAAPAQGTTSGTSGQAVSTLSERYPGSSALYPVASALQAADTPQPVRFTTVDQILVKARSPRDVPATVDQVTMLLRDRHRIRSGHDDDFSVRDMTEMMRTMAATSQLIETLLLVVALIALAVGGVGIMNIMLVSVKERTAEIGLRMAVGARPRMILRQFLTEAVILCMFGAAGGVVMGRTSSILVRAILHWPTQVSLAAIGAAVSVAVTVGLAFGYYPAWKASRLDPIEALRHSNWRFSGLEAPAIGAAARWPGLLPGVVAAVARSTTERDDLLARAKRPAAEAPPPPVLPRQDPDGAEGSHPLARRLRDLVHARGRRVLPRHRGASRARLRAYQQGEHRGGGVGLHARPRAR